MSNTSLMEYAPIVLMFLFAMGFVSVTMVATHLMGPKRKSQTKLDTFECGIESKGNARVPFNIKYFLVAILFCVVRRGGYIHVPLGGEFQGPGCAGFYRDGLFHRIPACGIFLYSEEGRVKVGGLSQQL